ncbi:hypothetical protein V9T40_007654 [Parthenolecanium corni]|uniref:Uncharacterized protein n=1 Tax=Parthenolecanium corni TaxID=536013 RepID=A0AAN9Y4W0_9HEMI
MFAQRSAAATTTQSALRIVVVVRGGTRRNKWLVQLTLASLQLTPFRHQPPALNISTPSKSILYAFTLWNDLSQDAAEKRREKSLKTRGRGRRNGRRERERNEDVYTRE